MAWSAESRPHLRAVEAFPVPNGRGVTVGLRERGGLSDVVLTMSEPALFILSLLDGEHTCGEVVEAFENRFGQPVELATVCGILERLEEAHFLEGAEFEAYYRDRLDTYRQSGVRAMPHAEALGINDGSGDVFRRMLEDVDEPSPSGHVQGLIAPHLDYSRGRPCYAAAYGVLRGRCAPDRVVLLGTNHFGRARSVVATGNDFVTPLGNTRVDRAFLGALERRCGGMRAFELDHLREHSIELQVAWLQFLFGATSFTIVPVLCPDPCSGGKSSTRNGDGPGLPAFVDALAEVLAADSADTLLLAGADLSHVGAAFGDDHRLDDEYLRAVEEHDRAALELVKRGNPDGFVAFLSQRDNRTNVCSAGCIFAVAKSLTDADVSILRYHQAVDRETQTCVTCSAVVFAR